MIVELVHINSISILKTNWRVYLLLIMEPVCEIRSYAYTKGLTHLRNAIGFVISKETGFNGGDW